MKFVSGFYHFLSRKCIWKCRLPKWRPFYSGGDKLTWNILTRNMDFIGHFEKYHLLFSRSKTYLCKIDWNIHFEQESSICQLLICCSRTYSKYTWLAAEGPALFSIPTTAGSGPCQVDYTEASYEVAPNKHIGSYQCGKTNPLLIKKTMDVDLPICFMGAMGYTCCGNTTLVRQYCLCRVVNDGFVAIGLYSPFSH